MRISVFILLITLTILSVADTKVRAQDCSRDKAKYQSLAAQLLIQSRADALRLTPDVMEDLTERTHDVLVAGILGQLQLGRTNAQVDAYLRCVQVGPGTYDWLELTNAPQAFNVGGFGPRILVTYWVVRGGAAIPSVRPYIDVYRRGGTNWEYEKSYGDNFIGSSFFVQTEHVSGYGNVLLVSGFHIGDPQTPFRIEVLGPKENGIVTLYVSPLMPRTRIAKITPEAISLEQSDTHVGVPFPLLPGTREKEQDPSKSEIHRSTLYFADILHP